MSEAPNLWRMLQTEWEREATGAAARAALGRWSRSSGVLATMATPAEAVRVCQGRDDPMASAAVLAAILAHAAADRWAARTVLQAVLPGLKAVSQRARPLIAQSRDWNDIDEVDQHVLALAYERIHALAAQPPPWPARAIVDGTWARVRSFLAGEHRLSRHRADLAEAADLPSPRQLTAADELAGVLADAVERGVLEPVDGWVLLAYHTRSVGPDALGAEVGHNRRWVFRHRARAERVLCAAAPALALDAVAV
jgi:hypothetical protein